MSFETGRSETMFTVPCTRGSRMKLRPVCWPTVLMTDWMSALTKLTVILSSAAGATVATGVAGCDVAGDWPAAGRAKVAASAAARARKRVTNWGFGFELSEDFAPSTGKRLR